MTSPKPTVCALFTTWITAPRDSPMVCSSRRTVALS
jgi:hypothetical protein